MSGQHIVLEVIMNSLKYRKYIPRVHAIPSKATMVLSFVTIIIIIIIIIIIKTFINESAY